MRLHEGLARIHGAVPSLPCPKLPSRPPAAIIPPARRPISPLISSRTYPTRRRPQAREELAKLGPFSGDEQLTAAALGVTLALWVLGGPLGVSAVAATLTGLAILLVSGAAWHWWQTAGRAAAGRRCWLASRCLLSLQAAS